MLHARAIEGPRERARIVRLRGGLACRVKSLCPTHSASACLLRHSLVLPALSLLAATTSPGPCLIGVALGLAGFDRIPTLDRLPRRAAVLTLHAGGGA